MHIRINIPDWSIAELTAASRAIFKRDSSYSFRGEFRSHLEGIAPGWSVRLLASARYGIALAAETLKLRGKRVAVPGYVCPAVLTGLRAAKVQPVAIDIANGSMRFDTQVLRAMVSSGDVEGILAANTYGLDQDMDLLSTLGLPIIEDAAYQSGLYRDQNGPACGLRADAGVWSFNFKALTSIGGGVLFTRPSAGDGNPQVELNGINCQKRLLCNYAFRAFFRHRIPKRMPGAKPPTIGLSTQARDSLLQQGDGPMSELQAAIAMTQWRRRKRIFLQQQSNASLLYRSTATCKAFHPLSCQEGFPAVHLWPILLRVKPSDCEQALFRARQVLYAYSIQTEVPYPMLAGTQFTLPNSFDLARRLLLVPCSAALKDAQIRIVANALRAASERIEKEFTLLAD